MRVEVCIKYFFGVRMVKTIDIHSLSDGNIYLHIFD